MNQETINTILNNFANDGKIFSNEQEFQFEFARELDKLDEVKNVKLEILSLSINWNEVKRLADTKQKLNRDKKEYTDIVIQLINGEFIAIELKFKTPDKICYYESAQSDKVITMRQGANDINAYYFIKDISRLENINERYFCNNIKIAKGYAIILTNCNQYRYNDLSRSSIWMNYGINDGRKIKSGPLYFSDNKDIYNTKNEKFEMITLSNDYSLVWHDYQLANYYDYKDVGKSVSPGFSYLVVEVKTQN